MTLQNTDELIKRQERIIEDQLNNLCDYETELRSIMKKYEDLIEEKKNSFERNKELAMLIDQGEKYNEELNEQFSELLRDNTSIKDELYKLDLNVCYLEESNTNMSSLNKDLK